MSTRNDDVGTITRDYYNSSDADNFYFTIWGGEDIHVGLYDPPEIPIVEASRKTVEKMASRAPGLGPSTKVLDIGSGYGGAARYLAKNFRCSVDCLNLSEVENERNRAMNDEAGLGGLINVVDGAFEELPFPDSTYDLVWSEDAILHSADRGRVFREVVRVLKPGGRFIFTDPMQRHGVPPNRLQPVYDRIHLRSLGSFEFYRDEAAKSGLEEVEVLDLSKYLPMHYGRVRDAIKENYDAVTRVSSREYINTMIIGLDHWVNAGNAGDLTWGILHFRKK